MEFIYTKYTVLGPVYMTPARLGGMNMSRDSRPVGSYKQPLRP